jgi:predicted nucleic acid-binding protein
MRTAIDTNVISAIWSGEPSVGALLAQLDQARAEGALQISPVVYAELHAYPGARAEFLHRFLEATGIVVDFRLDERVWSEAGERFARYAERRRQAIGSAPRRLLADFLIGAHALLGADRLLTLDPKVYAQDFPEIVLL